MQPFQKAEVPFIQIFSLSNLNYFSIEFIEACIISCSADNLTAYNI